MANKMISLDWEFFTTPEEAKKAIIALQNKDDHDGDESSDLVDMFNTDYMPFSNDEDLKFTKESPAVIKWSVRLDATKDIADVVIDKTTSVIQQYEQTLSEPTDEERPYDYTINEEIINEVRMVLIDEYQKEIPTPFNEIFTVFEDDEKSFGFDVYQLNITGEGKEVQTIDAASAVKNGVFDKIKDGLLNRVEVKTVE